MDKSTKKKAKKKKKKQKQQQQKGEEEGVATTSFAESILIPQKEYAKLLAAARVANDSAAAVPPWQVPDPSRQKAKRAGVLSESWAAVAEKRPRFGDDDDDGGSGGTAAPLATVPLAPDTGGVKKKATTPSLPVKRVQRTNDDADQYITRFFQPEDRHRVWRMLKWLRQHPRIVSWDNGSLELEREGRKVHGSNMVDILVYLMNDPTDDPPYFTHRVGRDGRGMPRGVDEFMEGAIRAMSDSRVIEEEDSRLAGDAVVQHVTNQATGTLGLNPDKVEARVQALADKKREKDEERRRADEAVSLGERRQAARQVRIDHMLKRVQRRQDEAERERIERELRSDLLRPVAKKLEDMGPEVRNPYLRFVKRHGGPVEGELLDEIGTPRLKGRAKTETKKRAREMIRRQQERPDREKATRELSERLPLGREGERLLVHGNEPAAQVAENMAQQLMRVSDQLALEVESGKMSEKERDAAYKKFHERMGSRMSPILRRRLAALDLPVTPRFTAAEKKERRRAAAFEKSELKDDAEQLAREASRLRAEALEAAGAEEGATAPLEEEEGGEAEGGEVVALIEDETLPSYPSTPSP